MRPAQFEELLRQAIEEFEGWDDEGMPAPRVETYREAGILSGNRGLVVRFGNSTGKSAEFQLELNGTYGLDDDDEEEEV